VRPKAITCALQNRSADLHHYCSVNLLKVLPLSAQMEAIVDFWYFSHASTRAGFEFFAGVSPNQVYFG
jgi:hypothetical protein